MPQYLQCLPDLQYLRFLQYFRYIQYLQYLRYLQDLQYSNPQPSETKLGLRSTQYICIPVISLYGTVVA